MRARFDGKTVASRHAPHTPRRMSPTTMTVRPRPIRHSHRTLAIDTTPQPVGLAAVEPRPPLFHADVKSDHQSRGLAGSGRSSPTTGTRRSIIVRLAAMMKTTTMTQAIVVLSWLSRQRRTAASAPM